MKEENKEQVNEQANDFDQSVDRNIKFQLSAIQGKLNIALQEAVNRGEASVADTKLIEESIQEAYILGQSSKMAKDEARNIFGDMGKFFSDILNPENTKYRQLYFNQRMITANLLSAAQLLQMQLTVYGEQGDLVLGLASALGKAPDLTVMERAVKED